MNIVGTIAGKAFQAHSEIELRALLRSLCERNLRLMMAHPRAYPPLKETRVRYRREPLGMEEWKDANQLLRDGFGDCEDLACYETPRLFLAGIPAKALLAKVSQGWHCVVLIDGSRIYDPSKELGM